ncbi:ketopantoate reductase family protein [Herbiconiux solani]|uniref:ketopantoate reductase family protein n=1 Tax=Herbiconiux solani TaxID=661329 RepID=UPI000826FBB2|nr:2-dehydropantoate 2-reductase [Herbiconiux solani]
MKIAVIGTGAIGGTVAALADRAGHDVSVTARGAQLDALRDTGLHLTGQWGDHLARPHASAQLDEKPELAVLAVKAQDAGSALDENAGFLDGVPLVVVQNGLGGAEAAAARLPGTPVIGALALYAASYLSPGEVEITTAATTYLGRLADTPDDDFATAVETFASFMPTETTVNFTGAQWTKLIVNQINALPAITGLSVQRSITDPRLRRVLTASMREAVMVARASGVRFEPLLGLSDGLLLAFEWAPPRLARLLPGAMAKRMGSTPNPGSTLQSIRRGQLTEIDHLNGAVVEAAARVKVTAPLNAALVALVHRVEREGAFIPPSVVVRQLSRLLDAR